MFKDLRKNKKKGFSLVELIVVIAIMAVMTAVLAPALLQYVEKSRAQKDDSAMGEVVQVVKLALADQDVYDECLCYTVDGNKAYYTVAGDEEQWQPGGTMRGLTITFSATPNANATQFGLAGGVVNKFVAEGTKSFNGNDATGATLGTMTSGENPGELYNKIQAAIPNGVVDLTSQTYRNSDYTVFITMGSADEAVVVTGQWSGTNIHADSSAGGAGETPDGDNGDGSNNGSNLVSVEELQELYEFTYYETLSDAISAASSGSATVDSTNKEEAIAGVYVDGGKIYVVLLKTTEERVSIAADINLNLGGNVLRSTTGSAITVNSGNVYIDARLPGSGIDVKVGSGVNSRAIAIAKAASVTLEGGTISNEIVNKANGAILCLGTFNANDATIICKSSTARADGVSLSGAATVNITNCNIYAYSSAGKSNGVYVSSTSSITISGSTIIGYANYNTDYSCSSFGVYQNANSTLRLNNCYVSGNHSGIQTYGTVYINGGTYEGYGHGGFYFVGNSQTAYVQNATIRECAFKKDDIAKDYTATNGSNHVGFYIAAVGSEINIDGCTIESDGDAIVMRSEGSSNLRISHSNIGESQRIRIDHTQHKLYIGKGNNFDINNASLQDAVIIETDGAYAPPA